MLKLVIERLEQVKLGLEKKKIKWVDSKCELQWFKMKAWHKEAFYILEVFTPCVESLTFCRETLESIQNQNCRNCERLPSPLKSYS